MKSSTVASRYPELGYYLLPGHTQTPADIIDQAKQGEALGMGSAWISERFDVKEFSALAGATLAVTEQMFIGSAATNIHTRHPLLTASMASTLHRLSEGRFALGVARGAGIRDDLMGLNKVTSKHLNEFVSLMNQLWQGQSVSHESILGKFPYLKMNSWLEEEIPMAFVGFGEKSVAHAGGLFDGVILHTFIGDEALNKSVKNIKQAAVDAGKNADDVKVWAVVATLCNPTEEQYLKGIVARMATYLQAPGYGELLVKLNGWDMSILQAFRASQVVSNMLGGIDSVASLEQLQEIKTLIPEDWFPAAVGDAESCAQRLKDQFDQGVDGVIIHASEPSEFSEVIAAYDKIRDHQQFAGRINKPF